MILKKIKIFIVIQLIFLVYLQIFGTTVYLGNSLYIPKCDSLKTELHNTNIDTVKVNLLNKISWELTPTDFDESLKYADSAKNLSAKIKFEKGKAEALNNLGEIYRFKGDIKLSIEHHKIALKIYQTLNNKKGIAKTFSNLGISYFNVSDFNNSLNYFNKSLEIYKEINFQKGIAENLNNIGILLSTLKKYESALSYYQRALAIFTKLNNLQNVAIQNGNLALVYFELKDYKKSLEHYHQAISVLEKIDDKYNYSIYLGDIGLVYAELNKFSEAQNYYLQSLNIAKKINDNYGIAHQYGNIGRLKLKIYKINKPIIEENNFDNTFNSAEKYLKLAVDDFHNLGMIEEEKNYLIDLSELYKTKGEYKNAFETYSTAKILQDSINNNANKKMIAELEIKQELNKKESEILLLNQENEKKTLISIGLLALFIIGVGSAIIILIFYRKKKRQNILLIKTQKDLRSKKIQLEIYQEQLENLVYDRTEELENEIKERKKIEEDLVIAKNEAETASNSKSIFLANMSHELRTPLVGILGYSDLMKTTLEDEDLKEMAEGINRTGNRLLTTVSMVLDLARIESGTNEIKIMPVNIVQEINEICAGFKGAMSNKKLGFKVNLHADTFLLNIDQAMFRVILENLINNAFKFTSKGEIKIETLVENDIDYSNFVVKVIDTGVGIKNEKIHLIFKEFKQLSEGFTKDFQGSGLGLSITKKYIELLGGKIEVESEFGKGTTFIVKFPIKIQSAA